MRITIATRLFLALTLVSLVILGLSAVMTRWTFERGFLAYIDQQEAELISTAITELADIYQAEGSWSALSDNPRRWNDLWHLEDGGPRRHPPPRNGGPDERGPRPGPPEMSRRILLLAASGEVLVGRPGMADGAQRLPIDVDGATVGYLAIAPRREFSNPADLSFAREQERSIYLAAGMGLLLAAAISALLARQLTRPIRELASGARSIAAGDFATRVQSDRDDELGYLGRDFNQLASTLEENQASRKRWVADIAHELRTPLAILRGELDAVDDGVRSFDAAARASLRAEVERLSNLVDDLHELSVHDDGALSYKYERVDVGGLLAATLGAAEQRLQDAGILLQVLNNEPTFAMADARRLEQVFANLLENTLRYTNSPGTLHVSCRREYGAVDIVFSDSAPGVPADAIDRLFDRLYRADASRTRASGGAGLGLAICKAIVEAHGGEMTATHSEAGGLAIRIKLPLAPDSGDAA